MTDKALENRLRRMAGQMDTLQRSIATDTDCSKVIPQFLAVRGALSSAFEEYIKTALANCDKDDIESRDALIKMLLK